MVFFVLKIFLRNFLSPKQKNLPQNAANFFFVLFLAICAILRRRSAGAHVILHNEIMQQFSCRLSFSGEHARAQYTGSPRSMVA